MERVTAEAVLALRPCWTEGRVREAIGTGKTPTEIAAATPVLIQDRRWVLTRLAAQTREGRKLLVLWAAGCAQDVLHSITDEDTRDAAGTAIQTATAWAEGCATEQDCRDAADAADACAAAAAYYAANASTAAAYASTAAAYYAAYYAADASTAAAYASTAAEGAAAERQLLDLAAALESL
jgi:hypothetical protein